MTWFFILNDVQPFLVAEYVSQAAAEYAEEVRIWWCIPTSPVQR